MHHMEMYKQVRLGNFEDLMAQWYLKDRNVDACTRETSASANHTAEIEVE